MPWLSKISPQPPFATRRHGDGVDHIDIVDHAFDVDGADPAEPGFGRDCPVQRARFGGQRLVINQRQIGAGHRAQHGQGQCGQQQGQLFHHASLLLFSSLRCLRNQGASLRRGAARFWPEPAHFPPTELLKLCKTPIPNLAHFLNQIQNHSPLSQPGPFPWPFRTARNANSPSASSCS